MTSCRRAHSRKRSAARHLDEADALADRTVVVDRGVVAAEGTPDARKRRYGGSAGATLQDTFLAITGRGPVPADSAPVAV